MRCLTRTSILAAACVAALVGGYGAAAGQETRESIQARRAPVETAPSRAATRDTAAVLAQTVAPATARGGNDDLDVEVDESSHLPVPKRRTVMVGDSAPYRNSVHVETPLDLSAMLGFYRAELSKRGWTEDMQRATVKADRAELVFSTADGPALLKAVRQNDRTIVDLAQRDPDSATKVGLLPNAGQVKVVLGNLFDEEAVITINRRTFKVAAGVGRTAPDGPKIDLPPGKYKFTFKLAHRAAESEEVAVGADEAWALLIDPSGVLPLQLY
jgi:hypothetical protein